MASFCAKCGAALTAGTRFCEKCGAPADPTAAPTAAPVAGPTKKGANVLLIVLIAVGALIVLVVGSAIMGWWTVSRHVDVDTRGDRVSIQTPAGKIEVGQMTKVTEAELGVPIYPGATEDVGAWRATSKEGSYGQYVFKTSDSASQVVAFYKEKLGDRVSSVFESADSALIHIAEDDRKEAITITVGRDESENKTTIAILRAISKKNP